MGHHTERSTVLLKHAKTANDALDWGISEWRDDEDTARSHGVSWGRPTTWPLMTSAAADQTVENEIPVNSNTSVVIQLCAAADVVSKTTKRTMTVNAAELRNLRSHPGSRELLQRARKEFGWNVISALPVSLPKPRKAVASATEGKAVTKYAVKLEDGRQAGELHDSQSAARGAAVALMDSHVHLSRLSVTAVITRDTGDAALVVIERSEPDSVTLTVNVTTSNPKPNAKQAAWLVAFDVHT